MSAEEEDGDAAQFAVGLTASSKWRAGDATAEVWRGENGEWAVYLCDVLRENQIRARVASEAGEPQRVLVRPAEEVAARRVLQAIEGAAPLEREA